MTKVPAVRQDWQTIFASTGSLLVGLGVGLALFGGVYLMYSLVADAEQRIALTSEDGFFEWIGAGAFAVAGILQLILFWRSDVPIGQRLIPFARRNVFHLGLGFVLLLAFAEEISWGQRVFGWASPEFFLERNTQDETNIHNLVGIQTSAFNLTRLFNVFSLAYALVLPLTAATVGFMALLYRRLSLPLAPLWVGGLFLGHFLAWRLFVLLGESEHGDEIEEAMLAICWLVLGVAGWIAARRAAVGPRLSAEA